MGEIYWSADNIGTIAGFFSADECDAYIRLGEATGFEEAPITTSRGMIMMKDVRNNDRVLIDDPARAQALYQRLSEHLAPRFQKKWTPVGLNERCASTVTMSGSSSIGIATAIFSGRMASAASSPSWSI
jgi:hypothetical protein